MARSSAFTGFMHNVLMLRLEGGRASFSFHSARSGMVMTLVLAVSACTSISQGLAVLTHNPHQDARSAPAGLYKSDPDHVSVVFSVMHLGYSAFTGRFNEVDASLVFDPDDPSQSQLSVTIKAASIDSGVPAVDKAISDELLKAKHHPDINFTSQNITLTGETTGEIAGALEMAGNTHAAVLQTRFNGGAKNPLTGLYTLGFSAETVIDRSDWGLGTWIPAVAKDVTIRIEAEFVRSDELSPTLSENNSPH